MTVPHYISNDPPGEDLYEGKPQERVAEPMVHLLRNGRFKLIGLDGSWGAGKSNVIRILEKKLVQTHHFFVYDAWSHQEDLQRRTFLEEFTADLIEKRVVKSSHWPSNLKDLLAKKRETIIRTVPKISPAYYAFAVTILLLSVSKPLSKTICDTHPWWRLWVQLSPVILLLLVWTIAACSSKKYRDIAVMFSIYKEKELEKETSEIISEKEPTVRQFRDWMTKVSNDLNKEVVVVFDNMDRLPADKVKALWSAIQTFFSEAKDQYPRISFIVPFDRKHIGKAFGEEDEESVVSHFINKTFPIVFTVALPPLTGWKGFFKIKFKEAFGEMKHVDYDEIENIFDLYHDIITPRGIIAFINEMVTLELIWKGQVAMRYIALFVSARKEILNNPLDQILKRTFVAKAELFFKDDDELPKNIAALVYNVPLEAASQVTLYREIQVAFRSGNEERIKALYLHPDFFTIFRKMIPGKDITVEGSVMALATLEKNIDDEKAASVLKPLWPMLAGKQLGEAVAVLKFETYQRILIERVARTEKFRQLAIYLTEQFYATDSDGTAYFETLSALEASLIQHGLEPDAMLTYLSEKQVLPDYFLVYVNAGKGKYKRYKVSTNPNMLDNYLIGKLNTDFDHYRAVLYFAGDFPLTEFRRELKRRMLAGEIQLQYMFATLTMYKAITGKRPVPFLIDDEKIKTFIDEPDLSPDLKSELAAMRIARGLRYGLGTGMPTPLANETSLEFITAISQSIEDYKNLDDLIIEELSWGISMAKAAIRLLIQAPTVSSVVSAKKLLPKFYGIIEHFDITAGDLLNAFDVWSKQDKDYIGIQDFESILPDVAFLTLVGQQSENAFAQRLISMAKEYISTAEAGRWKKAFTNNKQFLYRLTIGMLSAQLVSQLPGSAYNPFKDALMEIARINIPIPSIKEWYLLYENSDTELLKPVILNIRDEFINHHSITGELFEFFERMLREQGSLPSRADDVIRTILMPLLEEQGALDIIIKQQDFYIRLLKAGTPPTTNELVRVIRDVAEAGTASDKLTQFSQILDNNLYEPIEIIQATYRSINNPNKAKDATELISELVQQSKILHRRITNELIGEDPDPGTVKKLVLEFKYKGKLVTEEWKENEFWRLPYK